MHLPVQQAKQLFLQRKAQLTHQLGLASQFKLLENSSNDAPLPQFMLLGSSNVGKSSLLAQLLAPSLRTATKTTNITKNTKPGKSKQAGVADLPFVSKKAGFTTTVNVYTVPKRLRLIDSPGYGWKSSTKHGDLVMKYLESQASVCKMAYILILATRGITELDSAACELLAQYGVPFSFVVTKADLLGAKLRNANYEETLYPQSPPENSESKFNEVLTNLGQESAQLCSDLGVPQTADLLVTSTKDGFGIDELRADMLMLSGLLENNVHI